MARIGRQTFGVWSPPEFEHGCGVRIELTATVNGEPTEFNELTGEKTVNDPCRTMTLNTCVGNYGTTGVQLGSDGKPIGVKAYFYPKGAAGYPDTGDVLQRISTNKRSGRAVAFSNSIMSRGMPPVCERNFPLYETGWQMESKQDCLFEASDITPAQKYVPDEKERPKYTVSYEILETTSSSAVIGSWNSAHGHWIWSSSKSGSCLWSKSSISMRATPIQGAWRVFSPKRQCWNGLLQQRHLIPRSPSDILPGPGDPLPLDMQAEYKCPTAPANLLQPEPAGS